MASDFGTNLGAGMVKDVVWEAVREARYCYGFNTLVMDVGSEQDKLISTRKSMLDQVRKAKANTQEPSGDLQQQLKKANNLIQEAEKLKGKAVANKSCCCGVCPNWICRYIVGKQAARMTEAMKQLNERLASKLPFACRQSLKPMAMSSTSENFIFFECTEKAHEELLMALKDDEIIVIGFHGMGGCGKTSLLKEVRKAVEGQKLFEKVVYVVVSNCPNIPAIQDSIASWLGLTFETEKTEPERATRLSMRFDDKKFLIILDDVWEVLKFEDIGIPRGKNCKVLLSCRQRNICTLMDCQKLIHLSLLTKEEAWTLFQKYAGITKDAFKDVAQEIADECGRLPIAIKAVASTLKGKPAVVWEEALKTLRDSRPLDIERGLENPYKCLKLSFDSLEDEEERSFFLLCALFPEDSEISFEILIRFAFGLGIFEDVNSYERARTKVVAAINKITDYCLFLQDEEGQHVKMHDLVRDVALWVAKKKTQVTMGPRQNHEVLTKKDFMNETTRLYYHDINEFPGQLNCPKLEMLFVSQNSGYSLEFPDTFFNEIIELKVLAIRSIYVWTNPNLPLPQSVEGLKKLQTLCLRGWTLDNISVLGKLHGLHTLELLYCVLKELPKELAEIGKLKLLEVLGCKIEGNPYEVLARCSQGGLEELYFVGNNNPEMESDDENVAALFHQVACSKVLQRYHLEIGSCIDTLMDDLTSKFISINNFDASTANEAVKDIAQKLQVLFLKNIRGNCKNIIPDMIPIGEGCLNELTEFLLCDSDTIEYLIDSTNCQVTAVFSKLRKLKIETMECLEALCRGQPPSGLFEKLEELIIMECRRLNCIVSVGKLNLSSLKLLELEECPKLTSLFTTATAQSMVRLEVLKVRACIALENIIKDEEEDDIISLRPVFPRLKHVSVKGCEHVECIIPACFAGGLSQLESLEIEDAGELKHVFGKYKHEEDKNQNQSIDLPLLKVFNLIDLPNIISFCPQNYQMTWPSLGKPYVRACPQLSSRSTEQLKDANAVIVQVEKLKEMVITNKSSHPWNWTWQHLPAKKKEKTKEMIDLVEKSKSIHSSVREFIMFDRTKRVYDELVELLVRDEEASVIGFYGEEGCGKTSLAIEVSKAVEQYFDVVIFVTVSSSADVGEMQGKIASSLGLQLTGKEESERAKCLFSRLAEEGRTLVILDDVGEMLSYKDIGIPYGQNHRGCYVLLTTRMQQICTLNNCQTLIPLDPLNIREAWIMFHEYAGITDMSPEALNSYLSKYIWFECMGQAIAIKIVASILKRKTLTEFLKALAEFKLTLDYTRVSPTGTVKIDIETAVKFSYDYWKNEQSRSLFLLCSVFPEDFEIREESLARYCGGLGLFGEVDSFERTRNHASVAINNLIDSCLLVKTNNGQNFKMHYMVRIAAQRIAMADNKLIVGPEFMRGELKKRVTIKRNTVRYLWLNKVDSFLYEVDFPKLEFLFMLIIGEHVTKSHMTDKFFKGMEKLRVLVLENDDHRSISIGRPSSLLYKSLQSLTNLRYLHLRGWKLSDISFLESLTRLQTLMLWYCSFHELPNGFINLTKLRLLDLTECEIVRNPYEVIVRCSQLKELYLNGNYGSGWEDDAKNVMELFGKSRTTLSLQRYHIGIGRASKAFRKMNFSTSQNFSVQHFDASTRNDTIKGLVQRAQVLCLDRIHGGCKNIIPEMVQKIGGGCMSEMSKMVLSCCEGIECLIDTTHVISKPVFTPVIAQTLVNLEVLKIENCDRLECLVKDERGVDEKTAKLVFPKLRRLSVYQCQQLEYVMPVSYAKGLVQLEELVIEGAPSLKYVFGHSKLDQNEFDIIPFPAIKVLHLFSLPTITRICQENCYPTWPSLQHFTVSGCPQLNINSVNNPMLAPTMLEELGLQAKHSLRMVEEVSEEVVKNVKSIHVDECKIEGIFQLAGFVTTRGLNSLISYLRSLVLINLPSLRYICEGRTQFHHLRMVKIYNCGELKCVFSLSMVKNLSPLREFEIRNCALLKEIIEDDTNTFQRNKGAFNLCNLGSLTVESCPMLRLLFTESTAETLTSLGTLKINDCLSLETLIRDDRIDAYKKVILPKLNHLSLNNLPKLIHICQGFKFKPVQGVMFPEAVTLSNLESLIVKSCPSLKSLFTVLTAKTLTRLNSLKIEDCSQLEYVIEDTKVYRNKGKEIVEDGGEDILPELKILSLVKLPRLIHVCEGFKLRYEQCVVHDCPNLTQIFDAISEDLPHEYKTPAVEENEERGETSGTKEEAAAAEEEHNYVIAEDSKVIELSSTSCTDNREVHKGEAVAANPSLGMYSSPATTASGLGEVDEAEEEEKEHKEKEYAIFESNVIEQSNTGCMVSKERGSNFHFRKHDGDNFNLEIGPSDLQFDGQAAPEVDQQTQEFDSIFENQKGHQEQNFYPVDSKDLREDDTKIAKGSVRKDLSLEEYKVATSPVELVDEHKNGREEEEEHKEEVYEAPEGSNVIELSTTNYMQSTEVGKAVDANPSVCNYSFPSTKVDNQNEENQRSSNDIPNGFNLNTATVAEVHLQIQELDSIVDTQGDLQEQKLYPVSSMNLSNTDIAKRSVHKNPAPEEPEMAITSQELVEKLPEVVKCPQQKEEFDSPSKNQEGLQELEESQTEIAKRSIHKDVPAPQESKVATSSRDLIERMPQVELEPPQVVKRPQHALEEYKEKQHLLAEEMIDFHGLFKMSAACGCLLDEAFAKYPHLWNWHISQKSTRLCKWGYKSLADMLAFLKSETPKTMDDSKRKKFEDLHSELETFGFDKEWLASIRRRVMEMRADQLKSEASTLQHILNIAKARMASIEDDLSKLDNVFGL